MNRVCITLQWELLTLLDPVVLTDSWSLWSVLLLDAWLLDLDSLSLLEIISLSSRAAFLCMTVACEVVS